MDRLGRGALAGGGESCPARGEKFAGRPIRVARQISGTPGGRQGSCHQNWPGCLGAAGTGPLQGTWAVGPQDFIRDSCRRLITRPGLLGCTGALS